MKVAEWIEKHLALVKGASEVYEITLEVTNDLEVIKGEIK